MSLLTQTAPPANLAQPYWFAGKDRRSRRRFDMVLPMQVYLPGAAHPLHSRTKNISCSGLYFTLPQWCKPGTRLRCTLLLPRDPWPERHVAIEVFGRVVRVEPPETEMDWGIAMAAEHYRYLPEGALESDQVLSKARPKEFPQATWIAVPPSGA